MYIIYIYMIYINHIYIYIYVYEHHLESKNEGFSSATFDYQRACLLMTPSN